ncbi:pyruvate/2-oxoglutarate dehydrogenase complex dihydrolipoamide dehydrogenase (E3) component [Constrictibacter sp. MBR-5]|jgi:pyruvate/2-oxoglutarate dehydrogenase complex dihydrolipoamide dehydrogenase (E3) component|uniref:dihydrolipoyl dehydrogenase family protein n=1 Tax=Constrictibacter sp. MBR-5 TaxID=3156467 RepID=UPI0033968AA3
MSSRIKADVCVIGAGSGGLSVAAVAAQLGVTTVLIERGEMGGECLNTGCVPSKALIAAANAAASVRSSPRFGVDAGAPSVNFDRVREHVQDVVRAIAPHDSQVRFEELGAEVIRAEARFVGPRELVADDTFIEARRIVVATGSSPAVPPIPGLDGVRFHTNETIFQNTRLPEHLVVIGGGPIGIEMAQAHRRLGSRVTVLEAARPMAKDDRDLADTLLRHLLSEGIDIRPQVEIVSVEADEAGIAVLIREGTRTSRLVASHLLVATGRRPNIDGLDLDAAGIAYGKKGIVVDSRMRTSVRGVYAIGDVAGGPQFTHAAAYQAGIVVRNALFRLPAQVDYRALPWVTYTDPELAQVGLTETQAREVHGDRIVVVRSSFGKNDRARAELQTLGSVKIVARRNGRVLGASILGPHAGELIQVWVLAIAQRLKLKDIAGAVAPYPTLGEASKSAAGEFYRASLFGTWSRRLVRALARLP